jgi:cytochrome c
LAARAGGASRSQQNNNVGAADRNAATEGEMPGRQAGHRSAVIWRPALRLRGFAAVCVVAGGITFPVAAADVEFGRYLSSECMTCHAQTRADSTIPNIFGMAETTFAELVKAYRDKRMPNPVMQTVAGRLNDEEIAALAAYFATAKNDK